MKFPSPSSRHQLAGARCLTRPASGARRSLRRFLFRFFAGLSVGCSAAEQPGVPSAFDAAAIDGSADLAGQEGSIDALDSAEASPDSAADARPSDSTGEVASSAPLCVRLNDLQQPDHINQLTVSVTQEYLRFAGRDCEVAKVIPSNDETYILANQILAFNLGLWGCAGYPRPTTFDLIPESVVELTSADAAVLVEHYIEAANLVLELSPTEAARLRQDLTQLSAVAVTIDSPDHALSRCGEDAGAADGATADGPFLDVADGSAADGGPPASDADTDSGNAVGSNDGQTSHDGGDS